MDDVVARSGRVLQREHELQVGMMGVHPFLRAHAHVGACRRAELWAVDGKQLGVERRVRTRSSEQGDVVSSAGQFLRERPNLRFEASGERLGNGKPRGADDSDPQRPGHLKARS